MARGITAQVAAAVVGRRGDRGSFRGGYAAAGAAPAPALASSPTAPSIADQGQFPTLGAK